MIRAWLLALLMCMATVPAHAATREVQGATLEEYVLIEDWNLPLRLSGAAVVARSYLPFFVVGLYVGRGEPDGAGIRNGMVPCRFALHWLTPELTPADATEWWNAQFDKAIEDPLARERLRPNLSRMIQAFGGAKRGDTLMLEYTPDRGLRVVRNGEVAGQFAGLELNRVVLSLWLDPRAPSDVRNALLGLEAPAATH